MPLDDVDEANDTRTIEFSGEHQNVRLHTPPLNYEISNLPQNIETAITGAGCAVVQVFEWLLVSFISTNYSLDRRKFNGRQQSQLRFLIHRYPSIQALTLWLIHTSLLRNWISIFALGYSTLDSFLHSKTDQFFLGGMGMRRLICVSGRHCSLLTSCQTQRAK